jgi:hypothetical protein
MAPEPLNPDVLYWKIDKSSECEANNTVREIERQFDAAFLHERHDIQELKEYLDLRANSEIVKEVGNQGVSKKNEEIEDALVLNIRKVDDLIQDIRETEEKQVELLGQGISDLTTDTERLSDSADISGSQREMVNELESLLQERQDYLKHRRELKKYEEVKHEPFEVIAKENPQLIFIAVQTGYVILHSYYMLSEMNVQQRVRGSVEKSRDAMNRLKEYVTSPDTPGEVETDGDHHIQQKLDEIKSPADE